MRNEYAVGCGVGRPNAIADETSVRVAATPDLRGVDEVARKFVGIHAIVVHRAACPVRRVARIIDLDVVAWIDELILEDHRSDAVRIGDLCGDSDFFAGKDRLVLSEFSGGGFVIHLPHARRGIAGKRGVLRARRGSRRAPVASEFVLQQRIDQLNRRAVAAHRIANRRPWKAELVVDEVDHIARQIDERHRLAAILEPASPWANGIRVAEERLHRARILGDHKIAVGGNARFRLKGESDPAQLPGGEIDGFIGEVAQLDELGTHRLVRLVIVNLVDDDGGRHVFGSREGQRGQGPSSSRRVGGARSDVIGRFWSQVGDELAEYARLDAELHEGLPVRGCLTAIGGPVVDRDGWWIGSEVGHFAAQHGGNACDSRGRRGCDTWQHHHRC